MKEILNKIGIRLFATLLILSLVSVGVGAISAHSAITMDGTTGKVLFEKSADEQSLIASTTKIMTGYLVAELGDLDREFTIPAEAVGIEGSSLYLKVGEVLTVRELLYGVMLRSGNDAAVALAIATDGSVEQFAQRMNQKAQELGMEDSHFVNPNGLDAQEHFSTARDMAVLTCAALKNEDFRTVVSTKNITIGERALKNHNKMLWNYDGAIGVKTGFTKKAGRILVSGAERDGRTLVVVTINAPDDWRDHTTLLDDGFAKFQMQTWIEAGAQLGQVPVIGSDTEFATCEAVQEVSVSVGEDEDVTIALHLPRYVFAPVLGGGDAGYATVCVDGVAVAQTPLKWSETARVKIEEKTGFFHKLLGG